jgi:hypothetical protein
MQNQVTETKKTLVLKYRYMHGSRWIDSIFTCLMVDEDWSHLHNTSINTLDYEEWSKTACPLDLEMFNKIYYVRDEIIFPIHTTWKHFSDLADLMNNSKDPYVTIIVYENI